MPTHGRSTWWNDNLFIYRLLTCPPEGLAIMAVIAYFATKRIGSQKAELYRRGIATGGIVFLLHTGSMFLGFVPEADETLLTVLRAAAVGTLVTSTYWLLSVPAGIVWNAIQSILTLIVRIFSWPIRRSRIVQLEREQQQERKRFELETQRLAAERREKESHEVEIQRRRRVARLAVEQFHATNIIWLELTYPQHRMKSLLDLRFNPDLSVDECERVSEEILAEMKIHIRLRRESTTVNPITLIVSQYERKRLEIQQMDTDDEVKETILYQLKMNFLSQLQEMVAKP